MILKKKKKKKKKAPCKGRAGNEKFLNKQVGISINSSIG
jgi:hypothetical protein